MGSEEVNLVATAVEEAVANSHVHSRRAPAQVGAVVAHLDWLEGLPAGLEVALGATEEVFWEEQQGGGQAVVAAASVAVKVVAWKVAPMEDETVG